MSKSSDAPHPIEELFHGVNRRASRLQIIHLGLVVLLGFGLAGGLYQLRQHHRIDLLQVVTIEALVIKATPAGNPPRQVWRALYRALEVKGLLEIRQKHYQPAIFHLAGRISRRGAGEIQAAIKH